MAADPENSEDLGAIGDPNNSGQDTSDSDPPDWRAALPEQVRGWNEVQEAPDAETFYKGVGEMRSRLGRSLVIPTDEASAEARTEFYNKVVERAGGKLAIVPGEDDAEALTAWKRQQGIPEAADDYQLPDMGEEFSLEVSEDWANNLRAHAHRHGLSAKQFEGMARDMLAQQETAAKDAQGASKAAQNELREKWGDAYDQRYQRLATFLDRDRAPSALLQAAVAKNLGPETAEYLYSMVERMGGEAAEVARQAGGADRDTAGEAQQKIDELYANVQHPFFDASHPEHAQALQNMMRLQKQANPSASTDIPGQLGLPEALLDG